MAAGLITADLKKITNNYFKNSLMVLKNYINNGLIGISLVGVILLKNPIFRNNDA
jgi:hypothetical protein